MSSLIPFDLIGDNDRQSTGGKAWALSLLAREGFMVPRGAVIPIEVYRSYVAATGIGERIMMELNRKDFETMRWEEMWDASLRIRSLFLKTPVPENISMELIREINSLFGSSPVAVRSSAPGEDSSGASFAGLHDSFINIRGALDIMEHIRLVWASLWSDAALLYRRELSLDINRSAMAVVVQELADSEVSGVVFSRSPLDETATLVESVWGLNQGLVDGTVAPDRWVLERKNGKIREHTSAFREQAVRAYAGGTRVDKLTPGLADREPLTAEKIREVYSLAMKAENRFGSPQDVEWTFAGEQLFTLQSRPVTAGDRNDPRSWNLSLRRSFDNLKALRRRIEDDLIPSLILEAEDLSGIVLGSIQNHELAEVLSVREAAAQRWTKIYWDEFIPFAHGARLFGQVFNDRMKPEDPFAFLDILRPERMAGTERNSRLLSLAARIIDDSGLRRSLEDFASGTSAPEAEGFVKEALSGLGTDSSLIFPGMDQEQNVANFLIELSRKPSPIAGSSAETFYSAGDFLNSFGKEEQDFARELLDLARASYRLRDEDNIYLGRLERLREEALAEGLSRLKDRLGIVTGDFPADEIARALLEPDYAPISLPDEKNPVEPETSFRSRPRQLTGQPAGRGLARGIARVIGKNEDLFSFRSGEILVCDAIDPNMTFVVPLASGIVERRGGMLVHGAIIAREYGLACVTGVPEATSLIKTGDEITVDGYLGIVVVHGKD